jgi:hypothetical protein
MQDAKIKVFLFRIDPRKGSEALSDVLKKIRKDPIESRVRNCSGVNYRLEIVNPPKKGESTWELNFVRMRDAHGPGKVSKVKALSGFNIKSDEYFGEDTAVLYDEETRFAIVQYNHWGVRTNGIEQYLSSYVQSAANIYYLKPKLDLTAERRYQSQKIKRRVEIGIDLTKMHPDDLKARRSLTSIAEIGSDVGADRIHITISISSKKRTSSLKDSATKLVDAVRKKINPEAVTSLSTFGSDSPESPFEPIDLLEERLVRNETVKIGADRRISFKERINALRRCKSAWSGQMR